MKLTRQEIINLNKALLSTLNLSGVRFAYAIARNINIIKPELESLQAADQPTEAFMQYEKERIELAKNHAKKVDGIPQTFVDASGQSAFVVENQELFQSELKILKTQHQIGIDEHTKQDKELEDLLKEQVEINLYKISLEDIPQNITTQQMNGIYILVDEVPQKQL